jgi:DNA-binding winged helix-turn-helix (wHTH) protein
MAQTEGEAPKVFTFGRYVLDPNRGCLLSDGREIPLRAEAFAVLTYLARRPGQLVPEEALSKAAWPGHTVTDDTLAQCIADLRRVLGDAEARLIVTVPPGGYRFDAQAAPPERRRARGVQALRFRWSYGLLAPLAVALVLIVIWLIT